MKASLLTAAICVASWGNAQNADTVTAFRGMEEHWKLEFADEFEGNRLDGNKWKVANGVLRDPDQKFSQQWYDPVLVRVVGGNLELYARPDTVKGRQFSIWITDRMVDKQGDYNYSAGEVDSQQKFGFGMFEIRCKIPKGKGLWPAFWIYGEEDGVNHEIDIFEFWNQGSLFKRYDEGLLSWIQNMSVHHKGRMSIKNARPGPDFSEDFHVFSVIWDECAIRWYTDGKLVRVQNRWPRMKGRTSGCGQITNGGREKVFPQIPGNVILNVAVQNGTGSPDQSNAWPQVMQVDYFRYYKILLRNED
jgi:beta-glucanase (GH16 family)